MDSPAARAVADTAPADITATVPVEAASEALCVADWAACPWTTPSHNEMVKVRLLAPGFPAASLKMQDNVKSQDVPRHTPENAKSAEKAAGACLRYAMTGDCTAGLPKPVARSKVLNGVYGAERFEVQSFFESRYTKRCETAPELWCGEENFKICTEIFTQNCSLGFYMQACQLLDRFDLLQFCVWVHRNSTSPLLVQENA